jgi:hypothetical protein
LDATRATLLLRHHLDRNTSDMSHFYDVDIYRHVDEEDGEVWWGAEAGLAHDLSFGVEHESTQDLQGLIMEVQDDTNGYRAKWPDLRVRFFEGAGQPPIEFLEAVRAAGITLPEWVAVDMEPRSHVR